MFFVCCQVASDLLEHYRNFEKVLLLAVLLRSCRLKAVFSFIESTYLIGGFLFPLPSTVPRVIVFSSESCLFFLIGPKYISLSLFVSLIVYLDLYVTHLVDRPRLWAGSKKIM